MGALSRTSVRARSLQKLLQEAKFIWISNENLLTCCEDLLLGRRIRIVRHNYILTPVAPVHVLILKIKRPREDYHPQTNVVHVHRRRSKELERSTSICAFAYNTAKQETTEFTPFFLVHGCELETTMNTIFSFNPDNANDSYIA